MKTVTSNFTAQWNDRRVRFGFYSIGYKRRYYNGSSYVLESSEQTVPQREIDKISGTNWKYDVPIKSQIKASNVTIALKNAYWKWLPANTTTSIWRTDSTATTGYDPFHSQFTIYYGYLLDDGTTEKIAIFTGLIVDDPKFDSTSGLVTITLIGKAEEQLDKADATKVGTTITDHVVTPANGDGSNLQFDTGLMSLWQGKNIKDNAVVKTQGTHYTLDKLNDAENDALINFTAGNAPVAGHPVLYSGNQWYRNQQVSTLIGYLCDQAGITAGNRTIEEPNYQSVGQSSTLDSSADFSGGSVLTNIDATSIPGSIKKKWFLLDDFADLDYTANPAWIVQYVDGSGGTAFWTLSAATGALVIDYTTLTVGGADVALDTPCAFAYGTWVFDFKVANSAGAGNINGRAYAQFIAASTNTNTVTSLNFPDGYFLRFNSDQSIDLCKIVSSAITVLITNFYTNDGANHTYRITRSADGIFTVYVDTVSKGTVTDTSVTTGAYFRIMSRAESNQEIKMTLDNVWVSNAVDGAGATSSASVVWESAEIDLLAAPQVWGRLVQTETLNGGTTVYKTAGATSSGGIYESYAAISADGTILSSLRRYLKVRVEITPVTYATVSPQVDKIVINWSSSTLFIRSADFSGYGSCLEAVEALAKFTGMVFGTNGDGTFFFKNRNTSSTPDFNLSQKNAIEKVVDYQTGYKDIYNIGQVEYGVAGSASGGYYFAQYQDTDASEAAPTTRDRFGDRPFKLDMTQFIFANDPSVATAIAQKLYTDNYRPKRKLRVQARIIPHADLSDTAKINVHDSPLIESIIFGDPFQKGFPAIGPSGSKPLNTLARDVLMTIVGHSVDVQQARSVLDLEEIL